MTTSQEWIAPPGAPAIPGLRFRAFRGAADYPQMIEVLARSEVADGKETSVTLEEMANFYAHLAFCDPARDMIMAEVDGRLVAYGRAEHLVNEAGERLYCHLAAMDPAWRRRGIGRALLGWLQQRLRDIAATDAAPGGPRYFEAWASDAAAGAIALLTADGYTPVRHGYVMVRPDLEDLPDFPLPDGLEVRPVLPEHYRLIWDADAEAFRDHWGYYRPPEEEYEAWLNDPTVFTPELWQIAWDVATDQVAGQVRGYIDHAQNERFGRRRGWCEFISVRRPWRRRGLARALIARTLHRFREAGMTESALGVDTENLTGALRVYEDCGFRPVRRETVYRKLLEG